MRVFKKLAAVALAATMVLGSVGCGGGGGGEKKKVVIYTSMYEDIIDNMKVALADKFPDYDIEFFQGGTGTLQTKIAAEIDSGKLGCDMLMVAEPAYALELKEAEILHPYKIKDPDSLAFEYDPEGYWYPVRILNMVLAYNPEKKDKSEVADSFKDFATKSSLKGKISMPNPLSSGTAMATIVGLLDKYGEDAFKDLGKQEVPVESGSVALTKLESGECDEIMTLEESVLKKREEESSKLEVIYPKDGVVSIPSPIMTINEKMSANGNTKACEEITEWFLSEEGQEAIVKGWMHSVRKDFPKAPYDAIPTAEIQKNVIPVDWEKCYKDRDTIRTKFQEYVTIEQK
ncbi:MAG: ABC transporter substrate-binding protein [Eubacteriales bacterium]|nr:ABC transporter substrate-binding protein [Eubacteriales bacterium]